MRAGSATERKILNCIVEKYNKPLNMFLINNILLSYLNSDGNFKLHKGAHKFVTRTQNILQNVRTQMLLLRQRKEFPFGRFLGEVEFTADAIKIHHKTTPYITTSGSQSLSLYVHG